jgi:hypothetical protein
MVRVPSSARSSVEHVILRRLRLSASSSSSKRNGGSLPTTVVVRQLYALSTSCDHGRPLEVPQQQEAKRQQLRTMAMATTMMNSNACAHPQFLVSRHFSSAATSSEAQPIAESPVETEIVTATSSMERHEGGGDKAKPKVNLRPSKKYHQQDQSSSSSLSPPLTNRQQKKSYTRPKGLRSSSPPLSSRSHPKRSGPLPCADHLDPDGAVLPKSCWIEVKGILTICSLDSMLTTFQNLLDLERQRGIVDLDALWDPAEQPTVPLLQWDDGQPNPASSSSSSSWVQAAHLLLSPFGRPTGWHLKFQNRSIVNAILSHAQEHPIYDAWKVIQVSEATMIPVAPRPPASSSLSSHPHDMGHMSPAAARATIHTTNLAATPIVGPDLVVTDSMIRVENCPPTLTAETLTLMMSRYDLTTIGPTVSEWKGETLDGKVAPLMFVVHFADPSWARAAVRDLQATNLDGKALTFAQYPRQLRVSDEDEKWQ